ncbi:MAG TPA: type II toxin-antitoxin system VapB family antitoxin [Solirubrobacteraceae bacterium]|nr:type II toxin-antitoxin system VapB family antitoxin [Solirubrobacteraceae bacterium]
MTKVRTNIELDEELVRAVMDRYALHTKTAAVHFALRRLVPAKMTHQEMAAMRGSNAIDVALLPPESQPRYLIDE